MVKSAYSYTLIQCYGMIWDLITPNYSGFPFWKNIWGAPGAPPPAPPAQEFEQGGPHIGMGGPGGAFNWKDGGAWGGLH